MSCQTFSNRKEWEKIKNTSRGRGEKGSDPRERRGRVRVATKGPQTAIPVDSQVPQRGEEAKR